MIAARTKKADEREAALSVREKESDALIAELKNDRADLQKRLAAFRIATA